MLDDTSTASLYKRIQATSYANVGAVDPLNVGSSPSTSLVSSTGDSSTCNDDSVTIDDNDLSYCAPTNDINNVKLIKYKNNSITSKIAADGICKNCDKLIIQITSLKEQLFSDWNKRLKPLHDAIAVKQDIIDCYKKQLECCKIEINNCRDEIKQLKNKLESSQHLLEKNISDAELKQLECHNTRILLESALNSLNVERENMKNISYYNDKSRKSRKNDSFIASQNGSINNSSIKYTRPSKYIKCDESVTSESIGDNKCVVASVRKTPRRHAAKKGISSCNYSDSVDAEIFD